MQFTTNHLGHFALTGLLLSALTPDSRIINVASLAHKRGQLNFRELEKNNGLDYKHEHAYANSKLANLLFTYELQRRFDSKNISIRSIAAHPGLAATSIAEHIQVTPFRKAVVWLFMKLIAQSSRKGALCTLRAAVDENARGGTYYGPAGRKEYHGRPVIVSSNKRSHNLESARKLWEVSRKITGVRFEWDVKNDLQSTEIG